MKAIFFDGNGVLYARPNKGARLGAFLIRHGITAPPPDAVWTAIREVRDRAFVGRVTERELYAAMLAAHGVKDPALLDEGLAVLAADQANIALYPGVLETLAELRQRGFRLGVITDSASPTATKLAWFRSQGLHLAWDAFADSCEVGARKPDAAMYETALAQAGVTAAESAFVGHKATELTGAKVLGMYAIACHADTDAVADATVTRFADLSAVPALQRPV